MTTPSTAGANAPPRTDESTFNKYNSLLPQEVVYADAMSKSDCNKAWQDLYKAGGIATGSEDKKLSFRIWVYVTGALNGTSRQGDYASVDKLSDGTPVEAAVIPRVLGRRIRKFYRANMAESYHVLKSTQVMLMYPRFVKRAADLGVDAAEAFATCDWMDECEFFTPKESEAHSKAYNAGLARASRARGGRTLEKIEDEAVGTRIRVNGPNAAENQSSQGTVDF